MSLSKKVDQMIKLKQGDFSELDLNGLFNKYEFECIMVAIDGCDKVIDYCVLDFITTFAEMLYLTPNTDGYDTIEDLKSALNRIGVFHHFEDDSFQKLKELLDNTIKEKCEDILTKVVLVGCKHPREYGDIVKSLCYSTSDKVRLYCAANLESGEHDFSKDVSARIRKVVAIKESFYKTYNSFDFQLSGGIDRTNYFYSALNCGAINTKKLDYHPYLEDKMLAGIYSGLFVANIEAEFDLDVFLTMQDKKALAYCLNCMYEDGILKFKDNVRLPYYLTNEGSGPKKMVREPNNVLDDLYRMEV